jgi:hypothetical protein
MPAKWYTDAYRRAVIDMHIADWDDKFLSEFSADAYVDALVKSRAQSIVCYAQSHVGLFNYPTKVGQQHRGLKDRDIVQEMIERCHANKIAVVLYTSLIHDRWAFDNHPEWRMKRADGVIYGEGGRYGVVCPNSPYREYVRSWVEEICNRFSFEGMRFDMTFWVGVCYCDHCKKRFADEVGGEMPTTVNWLDEKWVALQHKREEWMADFASVATSTAKKLKPDATVEHQSSTYPLNWSFGVAAPLIAQNDFLQGDFYGDALQGSFVRKLLESLTPNKPFAYETSSNVDLRNHTAIKLEALLQTKASAAIADGAAFVFIDAIDPIGTVHAAVHERMGRVFDSLMPYYPQLGGERVMEVAVYYSLASKFSFRGNGRNASAPDTSDSHTESSMEASRWLIRNHMLFGVITKESLDSLPKCKTLILSNVNMMDDAECEAIRAWVREGGTMYASGATSLVDSRGHKRDTFQLADLFGVDLEEANWDPYEHFIAPTEDGAKYFVDFDKKYPAFATSFGFRINARDTATVLATRTMPWPSPEAGKFSSIHSNPPWEATDKPEIVLNTVGKGKAIYCSTPIEQVAGMEQTFINLVRLLCTKATVETDAPGVVELTLFDQPDRHRRILSLVNFQHDMPNVPISNIRITVKTKVEQTKAYLLPNRTPLKVQNSGDQISFVVPMLDTLAMITLEP